MPHAKYKTIIAASFDRVVAILADKVERPRKYIGSVVRSEILERGDGYVLREMYQSIPAELVIKERISENEIPGGRDFVFEFIDSPRYTGAFHNRLTRVEGRDDQAELEYEMDWIAAPGTADPLSPETAETMVRNGVDHLKDLAENPVSVPDWVRTFFDIVDSMDADALGRLLSDDCRFRVGNGGEIIGRDNIVEASRRLTKLFASIEHHHVDARSDGHRAYADCFVEYTAHDGRTYLVPFLTILERTNGEISAVLAYGDMSPVRYGWS
jgi:ketosteroid isomerase-like protein